VIGEAWTALAAGATLCLATPHVLRYSLAPTLCRVLATHVATTPALWASVPVPRDTHEEQQQPEAATAVPSTELQNCSTPPPGAATPPVHAPGLLLPQPAHASPLAGGDTTNTAALDLLPAPSHAAYDAPRPACSPLPPTLRCVTLGGEPIPPPLLSAWAERVPLYNIYGVTECTVYQASRRVRAPQHGGHPDPSVEARILGEPLCGCGFLLLDQALQTVPRPGGTASARGGREAGEAAGARDAGGATIAVLSPTDGATNSVLSLAACTTACHAAAGLNSRDLFVGQLAIYGIQLARGYWRLPERTDASFVWLPPPDTDSEGPLVPVEMPTSHNGHGSADAAGGGAVAAGLGASRVADGDAGSLARAPADLARASQSPCVGGGWRRVYLTGDLARWQSDGSGMVLCGRADRQVTFSFLFSFLVSADVARAPGLVLLTRRLSPRLPKSVAFLAIRILQPLPDPLLLHPQTIQ
jgi:acyl-CoA synthetase (AMP-forming)/AMP-acid ligase II